MAILGPSWKFVLAHGGFPVAQDGAGQATSPTLQAAVWPLHVHLSYPGRRLSMAFKVELRTSDLKEGLMD